MSEQNVGVVYADISGTTRLHGKIGMDETQRAIDRCVRRLERAIESNRGHVQVPAIDEMVSVFPDADSAMQAAIEMQERIADLPPVSGIKLAMRIGVHFGRATKLGNGLAGDALEAGKALLTIAGPRQIITCAQTAEALSPALARFLNSLEEMSIPTARGEAQLYALAWESVPAKAKGGVAATTAGAAAAKTATPVAAAPATATLDTAVAAEVAPAPAPAPVSERVCVRFLGKAFLIDDKTPALTVGRDRDRDIVVRDRKASRHHARIEKRIGHRFFLVDSSTNGTFVAIEGQKETLVRNEEIQLTGRGRFSCGHSTSNPEADVADFETL